MVDVVKESTALSWLTWTCGRRWVDSIITVWPGVSWCWRHRQRVYGLDFGYIIPLMWGAGYLFFFCVLFSAVFSTFSNIHFARVSPRAKIGSGSVDACTCPWFFSVWSFHFSWKWNSIIYIYIYIYTFL